LEPTIPAFEQANTIHALDRAASVMGCVWIKKLKKPPRCSRKDCRDIDSYRRCAVYIAAASDFINTLL
jgi:hypothetical protein